MTHYLDVAHADTITACGIDRRDIRSGDAASGEPGDVTCTDCLAGIALDGLLYGEGDL